MGNLRRILAGASEPSNCSGTEYDDVDDLAFVVDTSSVSPQPKPTSSPTSSQPSGVVPTTVPTSSSPSGDVQVILNILFDFYPMDISWTIRNTCPGSTFVRTGGDYKDSQKEQNVTAYDETIPAGRYELVMKDSFGDGLCCKRGNGQYTLFYGGIEVITSQFVGAEDGTAIEETTMFGSGDDCATPKPTSPPTGTPTGVPTTSQPTGDVIVKAAYNPALKVPMCGSIGTGCTTVGTAPSSGGLDLLNAKKVSGEPNGPNTLDGCTDGPSGTYKSDESVESITIESTTAGSVLKANTPARITTSFYAFNDGTQNMVDFYYASDPSNLQWQYISSAPPSESGLNIATSDVFNLNATEVQAVRVNLRWILAGASEPSNCSGTEYDDVDDLAFVVDTSSVSPQPKPTSSPTSSQPSGVVPTTVPKSSSPSGDVQVILNILFDLYPMDISWTIRNTCLGSTFVRTGGDYKDSQKEQNVTAYDETIPAGRYELVMKDSFGDGLCCKRGNGQYTLFYGGIEVITSQFVGAEDGTSIEETTMFGSGDDCY